MYQESLFKDCVFNPFSKKEMVKAYPRLLEICPEGYESLPFFDKVLRYVCFLYDPKSPLIAQERDLNYRKQVAAELAGFDLENDDTFLQTVYKYEAEWANVLVFRFLMRFVKQMEFALICSIEMAYWEGIQRIMRPISKPEGTKDWDELKALELKAKLKEEADKDLKRLKVLWSEYFGNDDTMANAVRNTRVTPESIALGQ